MAGISGDVYGIRGAGRRWGIRLRRPDSPTGLDVDGGEMAINGFSARGTCAGFSRNV